MGQWQIPMLGSKELHWTMELSRNGDTWKDLAFLLLMKMKKAMKKTDGCLPVAKAAFYVNDALSRLSCSFLFSFFFFWMSSTINLTPFCKTFKISMSKLENLHLIYALV